MFTTPDLNIRPYGAGRLLLQAPDLDANADVSNPPGTRSEVAAVMLARLHGRLRTIDVARIEWGGVGGRVLPRGRPTVAGPIDPQRRVYVVATHSGVTLAPLLGRLVRSELVDGNTEEILAPFRPERFTGGTGAPTRVRLIRTTGE